MKSKIELIRSMSKAINESSNIVLPYEKKFKQIVKSYFKDEQITEISFHNFQLLTFLNIENSKRILIEMNKELFN